MKHLALLLAALVIVMPLGPRMQAAAQGNPDAMQAGEEGLLARPDDLDQWIFLGATVGHGPVREGHSRKFSADDPGQILITRMEPGAYRYFRENRRYADGTTFAVSFYKPHENPEPAMNGLALGDLEFIFMHKLERKGAGWQHGFYVLMNGEGTAKRVPSGSPCLACHTKDGNLDGTFVQFYPVLRDLLRGEQTPEAP